MKKYSAIAVLLAAALTLSACSENGNSQGENSSGTTSGSATPNASESATESAPEDNKTEENTDEDSEDEQPDPEQLAAIQALIEQFDVDRFTAPDGTEVMLTEATSSLNDYLLYFDFAYIRYAEPIYKDTVSNPEIYDFNEFEFTEDPLDGLEQKPFKVVKGDVLDNGMKVVEVSYALTPDGGVERPNENRVELEGECTLEGVLFRIPDDEYYTFAQNDVIFYPNPSGGNLPTTYDPSGAFVSREVDLYQEFAFFNDGGLIRLGDVNSMSVDIADWFQDTSYIRVKVTLDGMQIQCNDIGSQCYSTLKSAEKLD